MAKPGRKKETLTRREEEVMQMIWSAGQPMRVRDLVALYPDPQPHFNTVSTVVRGLEEKGLLAHVAEGGSFRYYAVCEKDDFRSRSLGEVIRGYFNNSYLGAVSTLVEEEKVSVDELKQLIKMIDDKNA